MTYTEQEIADAIAAIMDRANNRALAVRKPLDMLNAKVAALQVPAGAKFLFGAGQPAAALGDEGDVYDNTVTGDRYAKQAGVWTFQYRAKGEAGKTPQIGVDYQNGYTPRKGVDYRDGRDGESAYQLWLDQGNTGSVAVFLQSLRGSATATDGKDGTIWHLQAYDPAATDGNDGDFWETAVSLTSERRFNKVAGTWRKYYDNTGAATTPSTLTCSLAIGVTSLTLGAAMIFTASANGGATPYTFEVTATNTGTGAASIIGAVSSGSWTPSTPGTYDIAATVTDTTGASKMSVTRTLRVDPAGNVLPVANAGADLTITLPTTTVQLMGTGTDADGTIASQLWGQVTGPNTAVLATANLMNTSVSGLVAGIYQFRLTVTDDKGGTKTDDVVVTVNAAVVPQITSFTPTSGQAGTNVTLTGVNFGTSQGNSTVSVNGVQAVSVSAWSDTSVTFAVPSGATSGKITLTNLAGTATSAGNFVLTVAGTKRELLILGTSIEITTYAAAGKTLTERLQALLGPDWVIRNYAVGGSTINMKLNSAKAQAGGFYTPDPSCSEHYILSGGGINSQAGYNTPVGNAYGIPPTTAAMLADETQLHQLAHNAGYVTLAITDSACGSEEGSVTQEVHDLNRLAYNQAMRSTLKDLNGLNTKYLVDWGLDANEGVFVKNGAPNPKHFLPDFLHPNDTVGIPYRAALYAHVLQSMVAGLPYGQPVKVNPAGNGSAVTVAAPAYQKIAITNAKGITIDANGTLSTTSSSAARTAISTLAFGANANGQRVGEMKFVVTAASSASAYLGLTSNFPVAQPNAIQLPFHVIGGSGYRILGPFSGLDPSKNDNYTNTATTHTYRIISTGAQVIFAVDDVQVFKLDYKLDVDVFPVFYLENGAIIESVQIAGDNLVQVAGVFINPAGTRRIFDPSIPADTSTGVFRIADQATKNLLVPDYFTLANPTYQATAVAPTLLPNAINGLPAYEFTGTNFLQTDNTLGTPGTAPFSYHLVCRVPDGQATNLLGFGPPIPESQAAVADNTHESLWHYQKYATFPQNVGVNAADETAWAEVDVFNDGTTETITVNGQSATYPVGSANKPDPFATLGGGFYIGANNDTKRQIAWLEVSDASAGMTAHIAKRNALKTKFALNF